MRDSPRSVIEPLLARPKARRATALRKNDKPRLGGACKRDLFGLRREMLLRIAAIEKTIPTLRGLAGGACGNRALEAIELFPSGDLDFDAVESSLAILEAWPAQSLTTATREMEAATRVNWFAERIKADVTRQADAFVWRASKPSGLLAKPDIRLLFYYIFADWLLAVAHAAFDWLNGTVRDFELPSRVKVAADIGVAEVNLLRLIRIEEGAITLTRSTNHGTSERPACSPNMSRARHGSTHLVQEQVTP